MNTILLVAFALLLCSHQTAAFAPGRPGSPTFSRSQLDTRRYNLFDMFGSIVGNFGKEVTASHILIGPKSMTEGEAKSKLLEIKEEVDNDPAKFADFAAQFSDCPSGQKGGSLGKFGPAMMVKEFDEVCFKEEVGVVHGPISTQFGEHLILINDRTGDK